MLQDGSRISFDGPGAEDVDTSPAVNTVLYVRDTASCALDFNSR